MRSFYMLTIWPIIYTHFLTHNTNLLGQVWAKFNEPKLWSLPGPPSFLVGTLDDSYIYIVFIVIVSTILN